MTIFIKQGDAPLSIRQATKRGLRHVQRELSEAGARPGDQDLLSTIPHDDLPQRLLNVIWNLPGAPATYADYAAAWEVANEENGANNLFNHQLAAYRAALARLARHRLADGRAAISEEQETGEFDGDGNPVTEVVVVQRAVAPLPAEIEAPVLDPETGAQTGTEAVPNPAIVADDQERAKAQVVIASVPADVREFDRLNGLVRGGHIER